MDNIIGIAAKLSKLDDPICKEASKGIMELYKKYQELGHSYDMMSKDLLRLYKAYGELKSAADRKDNLI